MTNEIWKYVKGYVGVYKVSNMGRVRSLPRWSFGKTGNKRKVKGKLLSPSTSSRGVQVVGLYRRGVSSKFMIHQLVAVAFLDYSPSKEFVILHKDGDKSNNVVTNLAIVSYRKSKSMGDRGGYSGYVGVSYDRRESMWQANIWIDGSNEALGHFLYEEDARDAYNNRLEEYLNK